MKRYIAEIVIFCIQLFMLYISPLFAGPTDGMGMVVLILFATLILSILLGSKWDGSYTCSLVLCRSSSWHVDRDDHF